MYIFGWAGDVAEAWSKWFAAALEELSTGAEAQNSTCIAEAEARANLKNLSRSWSKIQIFSEAADR